MYDPDDWFEGYMMHEMMNESSGGGLNSDRDILACIILVVIAFVLFVLVISAMGDLEDIPGFVVASLWIGICVFVGSIGSLFRR